MLQGPLLNLLNVRYVLTAPGDNPNLVIDAHQDRNSRVTTGEIRGANQPGQTFVAQYNNLARVEVFGGVGHTSDVGHLIFHLKTDPAAPRDLAIAVVDATQLADDHYWTFSFPPIPNLYGRAFYFYFEAPDAPPHQAPMIWYNQADDYPAGTRMAQGQPVGGDLTFRTEAQLDSDRPWFVRVLDGGSTRASIFENVRVLPRAWLVHQAVVLPAANARLQRLRDPAFDPAVQVLLDAPLPPQAVLPAAPPAAGADTVIITRYAPETVELTTRSAAAGLLVLSDQAFPGWAATMDGQAAPIYVADHALRAVYVAAGEHTVRLVYTPATLALGALLSGAGLLVLVGLLAVRRTRAAQSPDGPSTKLEG